MPASGTEMLIAPWVKTRAVTAGGVFGAELRDGSPGVTVIVTVLTVCTGCSGVLEPATAV